MSITWLKNARLDNWLIKEGKVDFIGWLKKAS